MNPRPVRLTVSDLSLERSRLLVFFRLPVAIPHLLWLALWAIAAVVVAVINWFAALFGGQAAGWAHRFLARYARYQVHLFAFLLLAANPFPGFVGAPGSYPVDLDVDPPVAQNRWKTGFRLILAVPALLINGALSGTPSISSSTSSSSGGGGGGGGGGLALLCAFLGWWVSLLTARMPRGLRNAVLYGLAYQAEVNGYTYLLTDRYPNCDPRSFAVLAERCVHPVEVTGTGELNRSRLTVLLRLLLAMPHFLLLYLWAGAVYTLVPINWLVILIRGQSVDFLHDFFTYLVRYQTHVVAYATLLADPYPGFMGRPGSYPVDVSVAPATPQDRRQVFFRLVLALPAGLIAAGMLGALLVVALLGWFAALFTARLPLGMRNVGVYALHYQAQVSAYGLLLLTERYPYSGPAAGPAPDTEPWARPSTPIAPPGAPSLGPSPQGRTDPPASPGASPPGPASP